LLEAAPYIDRIDAKTGGDNVEVFVEGWRPTSCHKSQETLVTPELDNTKIVIRMQQSMPPVGQTCLPLQERMKLKVADLPKTQKASYKIMVLGHKGWHQLDISHLMPEGL